MKRPRILLADDHPIVAEGLRKLLDSEFDIVGAAPDGRALLRAAQNLRPDVVLLDISMPQLNGIEAARRLRKTVPRTKVVFLTMHSDADYVAEAIRSGASGYVLKKSAVSELVTAIHEALKGRLYITPLVTNGIPGSLLASSVGRKRSSSDPTPRQREVLQLLAEGHTTKEIAATLHISIKTVECHRSLIGQKLGIRGIAELTKYAIKRGIVR
jgi:DNA-binding NarL/FixJ family response regulator